MPVNGPPLCSIGDDCRGLDLAGNQIPPRDVWSGGYLCNPCTSRLTHWIAELPSQWDDLTVVLALAGRSGEIVSATRNPGLELNEYVAEVRERIRGSLCGWSRIVCEERGMHPPTADTPHAVAAWLIPHIDWLGHQPYAVEPWREIRDLRREAWSLANPSGRRRFAVAPCPADECGGTLHAWLSQTDDLFPSSLACDSCEFELPSERWVSVLVKGRAA
jgi:hypothetical protein